MARDIRWNVLSRLGAVGLVLLFTVFTALPAFAASGASTQAMRLSIQATPSDVVTAETSEPVQRVFYVNQAKTQAVVITAEDSDGGYRYGSIWFVNGASCKCVYTSGAILYDTTPKMVSVKGGKLFIVEEGAYGSGSGSRVFFIKNGTIKRVPDFCASLRKIGGNQFSGVKGAFDLIKDEYGMYSGHSFKPYFYQWDGKRFVEYGGKAVSQKQLMKAKNGKKILSSIKKKGTVGKIWYRANGLISVNYSVRQGAYVYYHHVMLKLVKGKLSYYGKSPHELGFGGPYKKRGGGTKVSYPKVLPKAIR